MFTWDEHHENACERLKQALIEAPVLVTPGNDHNIILDTDASDIAMGAVLSQVIDGQERVVAYFSKVF